MYRNFLCHRRTSDVFADKLTKVFRQQHEMQKMTEVIIRISGESEQSHLW